MKRILFATLILFLSFHTCFSQKENLSVNDPKLTWWRDTRFGLFIHWVPIGAQYIKSSGGTPNSALWAPDVMKVGDEYRLYYSIASSIGRLSVIGLATASNPERSWTDKGQVVVSINDNTIQTNAVDPTVATTPSGDQYMYYGSGFDGIYVFKLNATTGLSASPGNKG